MNWHIAHIINPFNPPEHSDLAFVQPITLETIRRAKANLNSNTKLDILCACYPEDQNIIPNDFITLPFLTESVLNKHPFNKPRKLPLIQEILNKAFHASSSDYFIFTNIDISLYPSFYNQVLQHIQNGHDVLIINRRRIPVIYTKIEDLNKIYEQDGKSHPGFDCFVFHRSLIPKLDLGGICIGVPFFEISFSQNLFCYAKNLLWIKDGQQTFHIGMEIFKRRQPSEYYRYNRKQWQLIEKRLSPNMRIDKIPYADKNIIQRFLYWGLHPCFPIRLMLRLQWRKWLG